MILLLQLQPLNNLDSPTTRSFRLLIKKRLYLFNKEQLLQIEDEQERKDKLQETFESVVDDYKRLTEKFSSSSSAAWKIWILSERFWWNSENGRGFYHEGFSYVENLSSLKKRENDRMLSKWNPSKGVFPFFLFAIRGFSIQDNKREKFRTILRMGFENIAKCRGKKVLVLTTTIPYDWSNPDVSNQTLSPILTSQSRRKTRQWYKLESSRERGRECGLTSF